MKRLTQEQIDFLVSKDTLRAWVGLTQQQRARMFTRRYPNKILTIYRLRKVYKDHGIRRKKIRNTKVITEAQRRKI